MEVKKIGDLKCPTLSWPRHTCDIFKIGALNLAICQTCKGHWGVSDRTMEKIENGTSNMCHYFNSNRIMVKD